MTFLRMEIAYTLVSYEDVPTNTVFVCFDSAVYEYTVQCTVQYTPTAEFITNYRLIHY